MTITRAFVERNRLKKFIFDLTKLINDTDVAHNAKLGERNWNDTNGVTLDALVVKVLEAKVRLGQFQIAIDRANAKKSKDILNNIESTRAQLATVDDLLRRTNRVDATSVSYQNGEAIVISYVLDVNVEQLNKLKKTYTKTIKILEDQLAEANAVINVDIDDDLKKYLDTYDD